jgi:hypothetical protein
LPDTLERGANPDEENKELEENIEDAYKLLMEEY